ncbi:MAG TPA: cytochrome P450, partial [Accumulibacter sp.]|nr:cytochrome P450 [Accumulibacter sp.]
MNEQLQGATTQTASAQPLFNPLSPDFIRDPYPSYDKLRTHAPVLHLPALNGYLVSRNADAALVLRDKRFGKDYVTRITRRWPEALNEPVYRAMGRWMLTQDPPDHTRLRGLVVKAFTARRVEDMRPKIQAIVDDSIDRVIGQGRMDLISDFAFRLPVIVICDMLGIPETDREIFFKRERTGGRLLDPVPLSRAEIDEANAAHANSEAYFQRLFDLRRREPGDDLTTQLVQAE